MATFTCGCNVIPCPEQLQRLPGQVFIFYDRNEPGQKGAETLARVLGDRGWIAQVPCKEATPPKGWDISDALNTGVTVEAILTADGGTGKSRLSYDLAYAITSGEPWNGFRTTQGKVLIIQTDEYIQ